MTSHQIAFDPELIKVQQSINRRKALKYAAVALGVLLFLLLVFPTPYAMTSKDGRIIRVNRITGVAEHSTANGWVNGVGYP
jgi:hypothetical protein